MKISYSLRAFGIYFIILGSLIWFTLDNAIERLNDGMRQSAESVLVDMAQLLASFIEDEASKQGVLTTTQLKRVFTDLNQREFTAQIYQVRQNLCRLSGLCHRHQRRHYLRLHRLTRWR